MTAASENSGPVRVAEGSKAQLRRLAEVVARRLAGGDVVSLVGDLGAGKTFFAACLIHALGVPRSVRVTSPTFAIVHRYVGRLPIVHGDVYRLDRVDDPIVIEDLGVAGDPTSVSIVEWADRAVGALPDALWIRLERVAPLRRRAWMWGAGPRGAMLAVAVREDLREPG